MSVKGGKGAKPLSDKKIKFFCGGEKNIFEYMIKFFSFFYHYVRSGLRGGGGVKALAVMSAKNVFFLDGSP